MQMDNDKCRAGGARGGQTNYGQPHVTGAMYWEDGSESKVKNCFYCGKTIAAAAVLPDGCYTEPGRVTSYDDLSRDSRLGGGASSQLDVGSGVRG
jgi:hypothetical protein